MPPAISIVMPAYNAGRFIQEAIFSVLNQDFSDWEIVIVNDASTDNTAAVVDKIKKDVKQGRKIRLVTVNHVGCAGATHIGLCEASAPIAAVLDADDALHQGAIKNTVISMYQNQTVGFMWSRFNHSSNRLQLKRPGWSKQLPRGYHTLLMSFHKSGWWGAQHFRALRRSVYLNTPGLDKNILYAVDLQLAVLMAMTECDTLFLNRVTYWYRRYKSQITGKHRAEQQRDHKNIIHGLRVKCKGKSKYSGKHFAVTSR